MQPQTLTDQLATKVDVVAGKQLSDEVESIAAQLAEVVASVEQLQQTVSALSDQVEAQGQTISTQTQTIALLTERVVQLEQGTPTDPAVPENALTGAGGELLTSSAGQILTIGEVA